jgi:DNA polymerase elongation subunit (family B)
MSIPEFRLFDFQTYNRDDIVSDGDDNKNFTIKMFGMNEKRETCCIHIENFHPFFYVLIPSKWESREITHFKQFIRENLGEYYEKSLINVEKTKMEKLYGFNNHKKLAFLKLSFKNETAFNKAKKLWYNTHKNYKKTTLKKKGLLFKYTGDYLHLYEASLPALLRYFHIQNISPSGWITFHTLPKKNKEKHTNCDYEYITKYSNIYPLLDKETGIPMKIMSYDIEASSSHGDFPVPIKSYKKLIGEIIQHWTIHKKEIVKKSKSQKERLFIDLVCAAFKYGNQEGISRVYLYKKKDKPSKKELIQKIQTLMKYKLGKLLERRVGDDFRKNEYWEKRKWDAMDDEEKAAYRDWDIYIPYEFKKNNIIHALGMKYDAGKKLEILDKALEWSSKKKLLSIVFLPKLEGDKCTFIGSTFLNLGEREPYYNNMIVLGKCSDTPEVPNSEIIWKRKEKNVLLEWTKLIQKEDPDIIIGYNIFGFDWKFLINRAKELKVLDEFLQLGRNKNEICDIKETTTTVASGTYDLMYVKIPGRIQIDLYNYFRKNENLPAYKLDYVASYFIGDSVYDYTNQEDKCIIHSKNLTGLKKGHYICFEIIGHSSDKYRQGKKFVIEDIDLVNKTFIVNDNIDIDKAKKVRWCLAKDDVSPQDIFRLSNEGPDEKAIVAKYCFQDCNLVHNLLYKNDIFTAMAEQANICSVPIDFVAMRGQGIKLLSFIAKECATKKMCMPVIAKDSSNSGYEGAIVLPPKPGLYIDNPVAVNDYSSLYPSCMISENISHDSKVWTKEYDLDGKLIKIVGERNSKGDFIYDNIEGYKYVNVTYDTYKYIRKTPSSAAEKIICGSKICRFAQFPNNEKGIMPTVLEELLASRKATRKLIKYKTITTKDGKQYSGLISKNEEETTIVDSKCKTTIKNINIDSIVDTYDDFMKNVFDKRQLSKKIVANSLYGQSGAKTSSFYDKDIAASTTATGRKLLLYAKRIVEECYGDIVVETKNYGKVKSNATYIYGDTDSVFFSFNLTELDGTKIIGKKALEITIELAIQAGELASKFLKGPHDLEYEKTFDPFLLLSKKRYVGMLYETNPNKCKMKSMGIVLKRRDNAPCVKDCYGEVVNILMKGGTVDQSVTFVKGYLQNMVDEQIDISKLIITKSLNGFYKNPEGIAHKVLADRMGKRDSGNKPSVGSRIPYVYIKTKGKVKLQGDRIEHPDFIKKNNLKPDYSFYITNQIMKPVIQIFNLVLEQMTAFTKTKKHKIYKQKLAKLSIKYKNDKNKFDMKKIKLRDDYVKEIVFNDVLRISQHNKTGQKSITSFFGK